MNGPILRLMVRRHRLFILLGSLVPCAIGIIIGRIYPRYAAQAKQLMSIFGQFAKFFGQGDMDLFSAVGAFSIPFQHPLTLALYAILPSIAAIAMPAGERARGVLDQLLATRLERAELLRTVVLFQLMCAPVFGVSMLIGSYAGATLSSVEHQIPWGGYAVVAVNGAALFCCFGGMSLLVSTLARDRAQCTGVYAILVVFFFLVDVTARMWTNGAWLRWFTPYGLLRPSDVVGAGGDPWNGWIGTGVLLLVWSALSGAAVALENRRRSA